MKLRAEETAPQIEGYWKRKYSFKTNGTSGGRLVQIVGFPVFGSALACKHTLAQMFKLTDKFAAGRQKLRRRAVSGSRFTREVTGDHCPFGEVTRAHPATQTATEHIVYGRRYSQQTERSGKTRTRTHCCGPLRSSGKGRPCPRMTKPKRTARDVEPF